MVVQKGSGGASAKAQQNPLGQNLNYEQISQDPLKHVVTFIEKKIRNLDKRKAKLDGYRKMVENGQPLDPDQTAAASKYDEVIGSLEFAKDLVKSFEIVTTEVMKQQRKTTRREQIAREEADNNRVCFVMRAARIMELLHDNELMKEDFLNGTNGACVVSKLELEQLVSFYELFVMKSYDAGANVIEDGNSAGNHMYEIAEGRSKDIVGTTYKELRNIIDRITDSKYFEELPDTVKVQEIHKTPEKNEVESITSESSVEEDDKLEKEEEEEQADGMQPTNASEPDALSPHSSEALSSPSGFSTDVPLKTEEFLPSVQTTTTYPAPHTDPSWQQPVSQPPKPEAGDYVSQSMSFQYVPTTNTMMPQQPTFQVQTIQDVLAEVQGPCQFLQDSVIDFEVPGLSFTGMDVHQQPPQTTIQSVSHSHQMDQGMPTLGNLQPAFAHQRNASPADQGAIQQHLAPSRDSPTHLGKTAPHQEHVQQSVHMVANPGNPEANQLKQDSTNYHGNAPYLSNLAPVANPARMSPQSGADYSLAHQQQGQPPRQQADNLGLGQTTFGGQQQATGGDHASFIQTAADGSGFQDNTTTQANTFDGTPTNAFDSSAPSTGIGGMMQQHPLTTLQAPDPPTTHIPLPNEQQSGYRSYQPNEIQHKDAEQGQPKEMLEQGNAKMMKTPSPNQEHSIAEMRAPEGQDSHVSSASNDAMSAKSPHDAHGHNDQHSGYGNRGGVGNRQMGGSSGRGGRGNYSGQGGGYRSGQMNQGGGNYHQQRNYRGPGPRYNGNYDSMGRPTGNYSGGYQNNQSGYGMGYRAQQDSYFRRGAAGNMRGNRGGHPPRGNSRGGGGNNNYGRTRTFRPQHSNEQAA